MKLHYVKLSAENNVIMLNACPISAKIDEQSRLLVRMEMDAVQIMGVPEVS